MKRPSSEDASKDINTQSSSEYSMPVKYHPVDRGWAWVIMIGVFVIHFLTTGYLRSFGLLFVEFQNHFQSSSTMTATMSGVQMLSYSIGTFVTMHYLMKYVSVKTSCIVGCCLQLFSVVGNAMVTDIKQLIFTHGVLFGAGQALMYCPCMVILSEYFDKRRPIATVFATGGVSAGGVIMPFLIRYLLDTYGLVGGVLILAGVIFQQTVFVSLFTAPTDYAPVVSKTISNGSIERIAKLTATESTVTSSENTYDKHAWQKQELQNNFNNHSNRYVQKKDSGVISFPYTSPDTSEKPDSLSCHPAHIGDSSPGYASSPIEYYSNTQLSLYPGIPLDTKNSIERNLETSLQIENQNSYSSTTPTLYPNVSEITKESHSLLNPAQSDDSSAHAKSTNVRVQEPKTNQYLDVRSKELDLRDVLVSKTSLASSQSDSKSRTEPGVVDPHKGKISKSHLHPLNFPSDTLVRAMSTSSVDVLGSAHPISHKSSTLSLRRRGKARSSMERLPDAGSAGHHKSTGHHRSWRSLRFRFPSCTLPDMVKRPAFWLVAVYFGGGGVASVLPVVFLPPLSKSRGLDESYSSFFLVVSAITEMLGRLVPGLVLHFGYMRPSTVVIPYILSCGILLQLVSFFTVFKSLLVFSCLIGFFTGAFWAMQVLIVIEIIGMESLGQAFGFYSIILGFSVGSGYPLAGAMADATGTYNIPYNFFGALYLMAALAMILVQFTRRPEEPCSSLQDDEYEDEEEEEEDESTDDNI